MHYKAIDELVRAIDSVDWGQIVATKQMGEALKVRYPARS